MSPEDFNSSSILVKDIMAKTLISVNPMTTALQIAKMMEQGGIGAVLSKKTRTLLESLLIEILQQRLLQTIFHLTLQFKK